jgi:hypothetical protein
MRKYTLLLALIALLTACRHYGTYEDKDKWMLPYRMTRMTLRNRPRQVTEYIYSASDTARPEVRKNYYNTYRFDPEGNMVSRDAYQNGDPIQVVHFYYKGNRLLRVMYRTAEGSQEVVYFYSHSDAPDSLHIYQGSSASGKLQQRQLFFQNEHGDVVREIAISGKDTTLLEENSYIYDAKDNWVRRVKIPLKYNPGDFMGKDGTVMDREIVY